jgi:hypothetical protein
MLQWLKIADLVVEPAYQRPIIGKGAPERRPHCPDLFLVMLCPGRRLPGRGRTTSAAILGFESVRARS